MKVKACVRSGFCCERAPCPFGSWDEERHRCAYLEHDDDGRSRCGKYAEIMQHPAQKVAPAFGYGCCAGMFNEKRDRIIAQFHGGVIPTVEIDDF